MADVRLRDRERAATAGDAAARARLLAERLRQGRLTRDRLELAAHLGDPAAQAVAGGARDADSLEEWARGLTRWGDEACARVALATAGALLPTWEAWEPGVYAPGSHLRWAVRAARTLLTDRALDEAWRVADGALLAAEEAVERTRHHLAAIEAEHPGKVGRASWAPADAGWALVCAVRATLAALRGEGGGKEALAAALLQVPPDVASEGELRARVAAAVLPWVLG